MNLDQNSAQTASLHPLPPLTEIHFQASSRETRAVARSLKLAAKNSSRPPRSLIAFREQYVRIQGPRLA